MSATFFAGNVGRAVLAFTVIVFILIIIAIIVAVICCCMWRYSSKFRSYYSWSGPDRTVFIDRSLESHRGGDSWYENGNVYKQGLRPPERTMHTQTDLTAVAVLDKTRPSKLMTSSPHGSPVSARADPLANDKSRWSRINPRLYLNPWTYQKQQNAPQDHTLTNQTPRKIYVEEW